MICVRCGECCRTMSPLAEGNEDPCPHLNYKDGVAFCAIYTERPDRCYRHDYPAVVCPIGKDYWKLHIREAPEDFRIWLEEVESKEGAE